MTEMRYVSRIRNGVIGKVVNCARQNGACTTLTDDEETVEDLRADLDPVLARLGASTVSLATRIDQHTSASGSPSRG